MKAEDKMGHDRGIGFETDDEENEAQMVGETEEEDDESDYSNSSSFEHSDSRLSEAYGTSWPQSYRPSIDMYSTVRTPPNLSFLAHSLSSSIHKRVSSPDASLHKPFISTTSARASPRSPSYPSFQRTQSRSSAPRLSYHELEVSRQCSYAQAVLNGVNILCGVGLLATPYAIKEGGWMGLLILTGFGAISCYTGILLKWCLESTPGLQTYPDIGQAAFGVAGRLTISIILYVELYTCCVEYITLMSDNLSALFPNAHLNFAGVHLNPHQFFAVLATILVLPTVWLRNLSFLSYLSAGGVIASLLVVICLLWVGVVDQVGFHPGGTLLDLANLPVALGLYGFCYAGHAVFPNIYSSMKKPADFPSVLIASFSICWLLYSGVAVAGYLMFGESIKSQFTLNMPHRFLASKTAAWTTVVNPLTKYALTITPVALSLEELVSSQRLRSHFISVLIRTALVLSTLFVALKIPFFGFVMALLGSLLTMIVALIFPCASYLSIMRGRVSRFQAAVCILIIMVGITSACIGSYSAIKRIADNMA
ncbi:amino acid transporter AVT1D-like [Magnolia sinica]|uniref:amino acid transporter AVT1D-like n=1 Tax=Magnolia sinica TaxID=86752 RepID=UPI00265B2D85|nr:amino acid transporter AVT1D-like [Magnolia sinica]